MPLPSTTVYGWVSFDGQLDSPETLDDIRYYADSVGAPVIVRLNDEIFLVHPGDNLGMIKRRSVGERRRANDRRSGKDRRQGNRRQEERRSDDRRNDGQP